MKKSNTFIIYTLLYTIIYIIFYILLINYYNINNINSN